MNASPAHPPESEVDASPSHEVDASPSHHSHDELQSVFSWIAGSEFQTTIALVCRQWNWVARREMQARRIRDQALRAHINRISTDLAHAPNRETCETLLKELCDSFDWKNERIVFHVLHAQPPLLEEVMDVFVHLADHGSAVLLDVLHILFGCLHSPTFQHPVYEKMGQTGLYRKILHALRLDAPVPYWTEFAIGMFTGLPFAKHAIILQSDDVDAVLSMTPPSSFEYHLAGAIRLLQVYCTQERWTANQMSQYLGWILEQLAYNTTTGVFTDMVDLIRCIGYHQDEQLLYAETLTHTLDFAYILQRAYDDVPEASDPLQNAADYLYEQFEASVAHSCDAMVTANVDRLIPFFMQCTKQMSHYRGTQLAVAMTQGGTVHTQRLVDSGHLPCVFQCVVQDTDDMQWLVEAQLRLANELVHNGTHEQLHSCVQQGLLFMMRHCMQHLAAYAAMHELLLALVRLFDPQYPHASLYRRLFYKHGGREMLETLTLLREPVYDVQFSADTHPIHALAFRLL
jgi:hypothetical protein